MDFRTCVIDCIDDTKLLARFNREQASPMTRDELRLVLCDRPELLDSLPADKRECVAGFLMFVQTTVWQHVKVAKKRLAHAFELGKDVEA